VQKVDNYGCNLTDFANFEPGSIALIQFPPAGSPNACDVLTQASNAEAVRIIPPPASTLYYLHDMV